MSAVALLLMVAMQTSPAPPISDDAVVLEEQAFTAIEDKQWCLAMRLFEKAHGIGPAIGLLNNAARAAELAGDLEGAAVIHEQAKGFATATKPQRATATKKAAELRRQIDKAATTPCPALAVLQPPPLPPLVQAPVVEAPVVEPLRSPPPDLRFIGFTSAGVGGAVVVAGAVVGAVGLLPYFAHADAVARVQQAERDRVDASVAQADQTAARDDWDGHGRLLTIAGGAAVGLGIAVVVGGLVVALTAPSPAEAP